jgi:choline monooxygenase
MRKESVVYKGVRLDGGRQPFTELPIGNEYRMWQAEPRHLTDLPITFAHYDPSRALCGKQETRMKAALAQAEYEQLRSRFDPDSPGRSFSLHASCYTQPRYFPLEREAIFYRSWQWACHVEKLREPGAYLVVDVVGRSIAIVRDREGRLRAFYNVCKHRAHALLQGEGVTKNIVCPYHAWTYALDGRLQRARMTEALEDFDVADICLTEVRVEAFCGFVYVNLDPAAKPLASQSGALAEEVTAFAPDVEQLTFAHRLTFTMQSNWKNVVDNFLECYHCPVAHRDFVSLLDFPTYKVTTHGIYSSHMAKAGKGQNTAYSVAGATVDDHAVWFLWPTTCLLRYPGRGNFLVMNIIPAGPQETHETYDFYFETSEPTAQEWQAIAFVRDVLQREDIDLVESVQRGMNTPAFEQGRIVYDPEGSGMSEHAVHHFHGLVLDAYKDVVA